MAKVEPFSPVFPLPVESSPPPTQQDDGAEARRLLVELCRLFARNKVAREEIPSDQQRALKIWNKNKHGLELPSDDVTSTTSIRSYIREVGRLHQQSKFGLRVHDDECERTSAFGLSGTSTHEVTLASTMVEISFSDKPTISERLGIMKYTNTFNFVAYAFFLIFPGPILYLSVVPLQMLIACEFFDQGQSTILGLFLFMYIGRTIWLLSYILSYCRPDVLIVLLRENPNLVVLLGTRFAYTVCAALYLPDAWHIAMLIEQLGRTAFTISNDASMIFFRTRQTRETFAEFFVPKKGTGAKMQVFFTTLEVFWDVCRHVTVLYAAELAAGKVAAELEPTVELSAWGRAFQIDLKEGVNAFYAAAMVFQCKIVLNNLVDGVGVKVEGTKRVMFNSK